MVVIHRLQELVRGKRIPLHARFSNLIKAEDVVERTLQRKVLARFGVPQKIILVIRKFHDGIGACVRLNDDECLGWFPLEQGLRLWCMLLHFLLRVFFAAVIQVAFTRFEAGKDVMGAPENLRMQT